MSWTNSLPIHNRLKKKAKDAVKFWTAGDDPEKRAEAGRRLDEFIENRLKADPSELVAEIWRNPL